MTRNTTPNASPTASESDSTMINMPTTATATATPKPPEPKPLETELTHLAEFILERTDAPSLGRHVGAHISITADEHDVWSPNCKVGHYFDDIPCDEYERALSLGIAWMKDYIEQLETNRLENPR